jgi:hypothetical protein
MATRKTIGMNPLDAVIPRDLAPGGTDQETEKRPKVKKERLTVHLSVDLIERVKNAVYWTPGLTLAGLAEDALREAVDQLEQARGEPFPPRQRELTGGRPLK